MMGHNVYLNDRCYLIYDEGDGDSVIFIFHKGKEKTELEEIVKQKLEEHKRVISMDLTNTYPVDIKSLSVQKTNDLIDDIHLLADIYWLDELSIESNYITKPMKESLSTVVGNRCCDDESRYFIR